MHRLSRADLEILIAVTLATLPPLVRSRLRAKLTTEKDWARHELARLLADKLDNGSSMVVVTEPVGDLCHRRPGKWGVDEPAPCD